MRILVSGCTAMQVNSPRCRTRVITSLQSLVDCLRDLGHTVVWGEIDVGEDLSSFDRVILSLQPFSNWGTRYMGGVLWAWSSLDPEKVILTADDWQCFGVRQSLKGMLKKDAYFQKTIWGHWEGKVDGKYEDILRSAVRRFGEDHWKNKAFLPCFPGGDLSLFNWPVYGLEIYDPSPYMRRYEYPTILPKHKEERWILASLTNKLPWLQGLGLSWPCSVYGNVRQGQEKLEEEELALKYAEVWGILSPKHSKSSAAGWWRVRYFMAAEAGSVLVGPPEEGTVFGEPYQVTPRQVELMTVHGLESLAREQADCLRSISMGRPRMREFVKCVIS